MPFSNRNRLPRTLIEDVRPALSRWGAIFALVGLAGVAMRVWVYLSVSGTPNADEAVVGLMTRHFLHGEFSTFYWGQAYGGTQEVVLTMPIFWIAGSSWLALRLVPIVLSGVASLLVWRVGRRMVGEPVAAVAAALFWIWPPFDLFLLTHQQGFYASNVIYCALLLLLALRLVERPDRVRAGWFGLVLGLAFWQTAQIVPVAAGVIAWTIWKQPRCARQVWVAAPLAALGALPWIVWNAAHDWESLTLGGHGDVVRSIRLLASPTLPMLVGLRAPYSAELLLPAPLVYLLYVGFVALFLYGAVHTRRRNVSVLYAVLALFPLVYALAPNTLRVLANPRYVLVVAPVFALLVAQVATTYYRAVAVLTVACVVSLVTLYRVDAWFRATPGPTTNAKGLGPRHTVQWVPRDLGPLISTLDRLGLDRVYANYWLAYRLAFDTNERIVATENNFTGLTLDRGQAVPSAELHNRYPAYARQVRRARHGFVFYKQTISSVPIISGLERDGYRPHRVDDFVVYAPGGSESR